MIIIFYLLLKEASEGLCDLKPKDGLPGLSPILHIVTHVFLALLEVLMAIVAIDVMAGSLHLLPIGIVEYYFTDVFLNTLLTLIPGICLLMVGLIYSGISSIL